MEVIEMDDNAKCFIKINKGYYEEITYKELNKRRKEDDSYKDKKFIYIHKMLMEVSQEEYIDYFQEIERNRYAEKILKKFSDISIEQQQRVNEDDEINDKDVVADPDCNVEFEITRKTEIEQLKKALLELTEDEYKIIKALFYDDKSLRNYADKVGKHYTTIQYHRDKILEKLREFLKF